MNKNQHIVFGILSFLPYYLVFNSIHEIENQVILYSILSVLIGSIIPDIIEPATNWKHRGYGHSKRILIRLAQFLLLFSFIAIFFQYVLIVSSFLLGYLIHLLADSTTKIGLMD